MAAKLVSLSLIFTSLFLCQTRAQDESGIRNFQPSLKASCIGSTMNIRVDTNEPFEGIIHGRNRSDPECIVFGQGGLKTQFRIDLTKTKGQSGYCGVQYDKRSEERRVPIVVRAHKTIELLQDKIFVVTCGRAGFQNSRNDISVVELKVTPPSDEDFKVTTVLEGSSYNLRARIMDHDPNFGFRVRRCFAFDESDNVLELVDERGCVEDKLISPFTYDQEKGIADATIYSMFRYPSSNRTYFQCNIVICRGDCPEPKCDGSDVALAGAGPLGNLNERGGDAIDPFERPEDDSISTSTSVFVAQPGSEAAANVYYCSSTFGGVSDEWLVWLCIAFGVLFAIMLLINIFLCSAMTCSCTRSEIIEKEPSIYDDYSVYDSQYGYTNGKIYGSESDYGSEYGIEEVRAAEESDYNNSKYSHHGGAGATSTLSRSRH